MSTNCKGYNLIDEQIHMLRLILENSSTKGMAICSCDIDRVLSMNEGYDQARKEHDHLLSITLSDINAVPVVHYKGKQVDKKIRVSFDWKTNNNCKSGSYIHIEHMEPEEKLINTKIIQHNHPIVIKE